ncbi:MAG TPA: bifunctional diaminohydroxyphosphoribosylaminopyrimidine deaminase/5-amino-6-(5-phosphoribosylamino)uracil reductase RibD, partial [Clostridia bacterium]|nr:bifunctional diaminohydroxyphosphoribosylaminopyrimidine deaminase/5-amino-6-(5-phosphoribosylamino)uracil reductase RibD [Clostridia bacterium]
GYHKKAGTPHAEVHALRQAGEATRGATLYVNLEPCCHQGRTPPCTEAIIKAGTKRVVVAHLDPNPLMGGKGVERLRQAGIEVTTGVLKKEALLLNEVFVKHITTGRPFGVLKMAMTLDGKIATVTGDTRWISGPEARVMVHQLRDRYDAIMVGINTIIHDDPLLTTRLVDQTGQDPIRIILDSRLRISPGARVCNLESGAPTIVITTSFYDPVRRKELESMGIEVLVLGGDGKQVDLQCLMEVLGAREVTSILIEGGAGVAYSSLEAGIVDKLHWFIAPKIVGGKEAPGPVGGKGLALLSQAWEFGKMDMKKYGHDVLITTYPQRKGVQTCLQV